MNYNITAGMLFVAIMAGASQSSAQILAWDFSGESTSVATSTADLINANLDTVGLLTRGSGAAGSSGNNTFRTTGFQNNGISVSNLDYFEFSISAEPGYSVSLSTIDANFGGTASFAASPGVTMAFAYSVDGSAFSLLPSVVKIGTGAMSQIDLTGVTALQGIGASSTVSFRYYASGQTTTGGWGFQSAASPGTYGLAIGGIVAAVPEPSSYAVILGAIALTGVAARRRRV